MALWEHKFGCFFTKSLIYFCTVNFGLFFVFIKKLFLAAFILEYICMTHQTEICSVYLQHLIKIFRLKPWPFAALYWSYWGVLINVFIVFVCCWLLLFGHDIQNVLNGHSFFEPMIELFTLINRCAGEGGLYFELVFEDFYHQQLIIFYLLIY